VNYLLGLAPPPSHCPDLISPAIAYPTRKTDQARLDEDNMEDADRARLAVGEAKLTKMHASLNKLETLATQIDGQLMMLRDFSEFTPLKRNWHRI